MDRGAHWEQLTAAFRAELEDRVRALNQLFLRLERDEGGYAALGETLNALFRETHSLKGAARALRLSSVEQLAHGLESALDAARSRGEQPPTEWFDTAYEAVDAFGPTAAVDLGEGTEPPLGPDLPARLPDPPRAFQSPGADVVGGTAGSAAVAPSPAPPAPPATSLSRAPASAGRAPEREGGSAASPPVADPALTAPAPTRSPAQPRSPTESVRVAVPKLDALLTQAGELTVTQIRVAQRQRDVQDLSRDVEAWRREWRRVRQVRASLRAAAALPDTGRTLRRDLAALLHFVERSEERIQDLLRRTEGLAGQFRGDVIELGVVTRTIESEVMSIRLLPMSTLFAPLERAVRDLARDLGKEARLAVTGSDTEIDRKILDQLRDPVLHLVRNAVDHGLEAPDRRQAAGKPAVGTIELTANQHGGVVEIVLSDDGEGLDPARLRAAAIRKGLLSADQAAVLEDAGAHALIFLPGFSTKTEVTETSGRGVGMDVVRDQVEWLQGTIDVSSVPGAGTRFRITIPLTLATTRALILDCAGQIFAVPAAAIETSAQVDERQLTSLEGRRTVSLHGQAVVAVELAEVIEHPRRAALAASTPGADGRGGKRPFFVLHLGERRVALLADRLIGEQELVVKRLSWPLRRVRNVGGAAVRGSGETVLILNPADLIRSALRSRAGPARAAVAPEAAPRRPRRHRVLVVDDSLTTRTLERSILEAAGYEVAVAADGAAALDLLRAEPVDLVVSDVEMPHLDGFELTAALRRDDALRTIPVILVTSLEAPEHRERGLAAGADAYIVKSGFDQTTLLDTIGRLL